MAEIRQVALVTGGVRGIGLGIARCLADAGFDLTVGGTRTEDEVEDVLDDLREAGSDVLYCMGDVSDAA